MLETQPEDGSQNVSGRAKLRRFGLLLLLGLELVAAAFFCSLCIGIAIDVFPHGAQPTGLLALLTREVGVVALSLGTLIWIKDVARLARPNRDGMPSIVSAILLHILIICTSTLAAVLAARPIMGFFVAVG